jgi:hypothetical protein
MNHRLLVPTPCQVSGTKKMVIRANTTDEWTGPFPPPPPQKRMPYEGNVNSPSTWRVSFECTSGGLHSYEGPSEASPGDLGGSPRMEGQGPKPRICLHEMNDELLNLRMAKQVGCHENENTKAARCLGSGREFSQDEGIQEIWGGFSQEACDGIPRHRQPVIWVQSSFGPCFHPRYPQTPRAPSDALRSLQWIILRLVCE